MSGSLAFTQDCATMRKLRILAFFFITYGIYGKVVGGDQRRHMEIASGMQSLGAEVFSLEYKPSLSKSWGYSNHHVIEYRKRFEKHGLVEIFVQTLNGLRCCRQFKCDVVFVPAPNLIGTFDMIPPLLVSILCRKPLVIVLHANQRSVNDPNRFAKDRNPIRFLAFLRARTCISVSQASAVDMRKIFKLNHVIVTGNGVNLNKFSKSKKQTPVYDVIFFGRISVEKGLSTLLEAWKIVVAEMPQVKLVFMGGFSGNQKEEMMRIIERLEISNNVEFTGFVTDQEVVHKLNSSRIFVLPSIDEGFGLTVLEAMAAGLPCILSDLPTFKENFGSTAVFFEGRNAKSLAQQIMKLLSNPALRMELGKKGQEMAKKHSWENVAKKELKVLESVST